MGWSEMAVDSWQAAESLWPAHRRSGFSRLYYAAYCATAGWLEARSVPGDVLSSGDEWYAHSKLVKHLHTATADYEPFDEAAPLGDDLIRDLARALGNLWDFRRAADYYPDESTEQDLTEADYEDVRTDALLVLHTFGVLGEDGHG